jgi:hypothetical protein
MFGIIINYDCVNAASSKLLAKTMEHAINNDFELIGLDRDLVNNYIILKSKSVRTPQINARIGPWLLDK